MQPKAIVIVDSRGVLNSKNKYDLNRHIEYANRITKVNQEIRFIVVTTNPSFEGSSELAELEVFGYQGNRRLSPRFLYSVIKFINLQGFKKILMIAGDPWESAINVRIVGRFTHINFSSQVQIHADITSSAWVKLSLINRFRKFLLRFTLEKFDSIRVTSNEILTGISEFYGIPKNRIIVSNLRLNLELEAKVELAPNRPRTISFVGRLDKDRGLETFVEIVKKIAGLNLYVNIVGAGACEKEFKNELEEILGADNVHFWGELKPQDMAAIWNQSGILVSTAPSESFGRTIREAACFGIPVMGVASRGFHEFTTFASVPWIRILDTEWSDLEIQANVEELLRIETSLTVREKILRAQDEEIDILIKEWLTLLEIDGPFK
jgi:glycosyltransferase involved in cell wall biosynthesis